MTATEEKKKIIEILYKQFGSFKLSKGQSARILGISISSLDRQRKSGVGMSYSQQNKTSSVYYRLKVIADYIVDNDIQTI